MEKRGRVPGDLDPSDGTAVASAAASTRRTAAQTRPSFFLISLPFANCWSHHSSISMIHSSLSLSLFLPLSSGMSFHIRGLISRSSVSLVSLLKYDWAWEWQMNSQSECILSPSLLSLSAALHLSPQATHSTSPPLYPPLPAHPWQTLMGFRANCSPLEEKKRQNNIKGRIVSAIADCHFAWLCDMMEQRAL